MDICIRRDRQRAADRLDPIDEVVLDDERARLAVGHDVLDLGADQPEVDRNRDQARAREPT